MAEWIMKTSPGQKVTDSEIGIGSSIAEKNREPILIRHIYSRAASVTPQRLSRERY